MNLLKILPWLVDKRMTQHPNKETAVYDCCNNIANSDRNIIPY